MRLFSCITPNPVTLTFSLDTNPHTQSLAQGWGIAWYDVKRIPHIEKRHRSLLSPENNQPITKTVTTNVFLSHTRFASSGHIADENTHPFQFNDYVFAHSGQVNKLILIETLIPPFNTNFQSDPIDSEVLFHAILQNIKQHGIPGGFQSALEMANDARGTNFALTDGATVYAYRHGLPLYYLIRKKQTPLQAFSQETSVSISCDDLAKTPAILIASEKLTDDNWIALDDGELFTAYANFSYTATRMFI